LIYSNGVAFSAWANNSSKKSRPASVSTKLPRAFSKTILRRSSRRLISFHSGALLPNFLTVFTPIQTAGVGQYGANWQSAPHMNLTFSTLFTPENLMIERGFVLNMLVPIAVVKALKRLGIGEEINIKWPNDIVITRKKIGGILIENIVQGQQIIKNVIGIGLNVNQTNFEGLPKASSLAKITGHTLEVKKVLEEVMCALEETLLQPLDFEQVYPEYEALLFGLEKVATFRLPEGEIFIDGKNPGVETKKIVAYLPDKNYLDNSKTVKAILQLFADFYDDFDLERAQNMLKDLGIDITRRFKLLSKGTKEKVQLILVMCRRAKLYLLDEPIAGVDPAARDYILNTVIKNYNREATVIISTHLIADVEKVLDEAIFIRKGEILLYQDVKSIINEHNKTVDEYFREVFKY